jgi:hypothetical protein
LKKCTSVSPTLHSAGHSWKSVTFWSKPRPRKRANGAAAGSLSNSGTTSNSTPSGNRSCPTPGMAHLAQNPQVNFSEIVSKKLGGTCPDDSQMLMMYQLRNLGNQMAEREGFEPSVRLPVRSLSKGVLSTTQPSFLKAGREVSIIAGRRRQPQWRKIPRRLRIRCFHLQPERVFVLRSARLWGIRQ